MNSSTRKHPGAALALLHSGCLPLNQAEISAPDRMQTRITVRVYPPDAEEWSPSLVSEIVVSTHTPGAAHIVHRLTVAENSAAMEITIN